MAILGDDLWSYNLARVILVDVTDDYRLSQDPLPLDCYPVLEEQFRPVYQLEEQLIGPDILPGFAYDWHVRPTDFSEPWFVAVVQREFMAAAAHS